jgi:hypothetical protein
MRHVSYLAILAVTFFVVSPRVRGQATQTQPSARPSLPYTAVHNPQFVKSSEAAFMHPNDRVIGLLSGNVAKAYPGAILSQHGLVEDDSPTGPIAITW